MSVAAYVLDLLGRPTVRPHVEAARRHMTAGEWQLAADAIYRASALTSRRAKDGSANTVSGLEIVRFLCRTDAGFSRKAATKLRAALSPIMDGGFYRRRPFKFVKRSDSECSWMSAFGFKDGVAYGVTVDPHPAGWLDRLRRRVRWRLPG